MGKDWSLLGREPSFPCFCSHGVFGSKTFWGVLSSGPLPVIFWDFRILSIYSPGCLSFRSSPQLGWAIATFLCSRR